MQTFLPYSDFRISAKVLDRSRLGKQRVEVLQLLNVLTGNSKGPGWINHPATKMWRGYEFALSTYGFFICNEWKNRGYKDTCLDKIATITPKPINHECLITVEMPPWLGNLEFHASHRSNLLRKDPIWYKQFNWEESNNLSYVWPIK